MGNTEKVACSPRSIERIEDQEESDLSYDTVSGSPARSGGWRQSEAGDPARFPLQPGAAQHAISLSAAGGSVDHTASLHKYKLNLLQQERKTGSLTFGVQSLVAAGPTCCQGKRGSLGPKFPAQRGLLGADHTCVAVLIVLSPPAAGTTILGVLGAAAWKRGRRGVTLGGSLDMN